MKNKKTILYSFLSLALVYHLLAVSLLPNPSSLIARAFEPMITPWANLFHLNTTWQFFSPDPAGNLYISYEVLKTDDEGEEGELFQWPPVNHGQYNFDNYYRLIYNSRYVTMGQKKIDEFLIPWLCRLHPEAKSIVLKGVEEDIPSIDYARIQGKSFEKMKFDREWTEQVKACIRGDQG